ncbi:unnamed protein product [Durusdinium trenchii]|uniref:Ubiquitin-like domain-containing protein n=1 Tax=Durusdinium trenchii TaxID=1381693 RepID=A0ABP0SMT0_9DINO
MEPIAINVMLPSGEQVAQLMVSPEKPMMQMKTQIAGLEGTPVANQVLLFEDRPVDDSETLRSLHVSKEATFLLLRRAPLLSGAINREELEHLLEDNLALEQAIVAYSDSLQYLPSDILTISDEVTEGLIASGSAHEKAELISNRQPEQWQDIAQQTGKARQMAFSRALKAELERIQAALPLRRTPPANSGARLRPLRPESPSEEQVEAPTAQPEEQPQAHLQLPAPQALQAQTRAQPVEAAELAQPARRTGAAAAAKSASYYMQPLSPAEHAEPGLDEVSLKHIDVEKDEGRFAHNPWMGAGMELKKYLHRQWAVCEGEGPD